MTSLRPVWLCEPVRRQLAAEAWALLAGQEVVGGDVRHRVQRVAQTLIGQQVVTVTTPRSTLPSTWRRADLPRRDQRLHGAAGPLFGRSPVSPATRRSPRPSLPSTRSSTTAGSPRPARHHSTGRAGRGVKCCLRVSPLRLGALRRQGGPAEQSPGLWGRMRPGLEQSFEQVGPGGPRTVRSAPPYHEGRSLFGYQKISIRVTLCTWPGFHALHFPMVTLSILGLPTLLWN